MTTAVRMMFEHGARPRKKDVFGRTLLHYPVTPSGHSPRRERNVQPVELLLRCKAISESGRLYDEEGLVLQR